MNIILTSSTKHLEPHLQLPELFYRLIQFDDGELYVKISTQLQNQPVWVIAATPAPGDNILELLFILDALQRQKASINLIITYFGYARQDRASAGEALSAEVLSHCITRFPLASTTVIHAHSKALHDFLPFENCFPMQHIGEIAHTYDCVVAPDHGAREFVQHVAKQCSIQAIFLEKERLVKDEALVTTFDGHKDIRGKRMLIIDDMISTGRTIISASKMLKQHGASHVDVYATHGLFSGDCYDRILTSDIGTVYVTNSLHQIPRERLNIVDITPFLRTLVKTKIS